MGVGVGVTVDTSVGAGVVVVPSSVVPDAVGVMKGVGVASAMTTDCGVFKMREVGIETGTDVGAEAQAMKIAAHAISIAPRASRVSLSIACHFSTRIGDRQIISTAS